MIEVNDKSSKEFKVSFSQPNGDPLTPESVHVMIQDKTTGAVIRERQAVATLSSEITIRTTAEENTINTEIPHRVFRLTIEATDAQQNQITESVCYKVLNNTSI